VRPDRTASMPMRPPPSTRLASLFSLIRRTLGLEGRLDLRHRGGQTGANEPVDALGDRDAEHRRRRLVGNAQHDPHTVRGGLEAEPAFLLDRAGLGDPSDLTPAAPAVQTQHRAQRKPERGHLDRVARAGPLRLRADWLPAIDALEHARDVAVVGEIVKGLLRRGRHLDRDGQLELGQYSKNDMRWMDGRVWVEDSVETPQPPALERIREAFMPDTAAMTLGLVQARDHALVSGPVELLRFGDAESSRGSVSWPIEGGVLAAEPGGRLRVSIEKDRLVARVEGYRPALPRGLYPLTQPPLHHAVVRMVLLRLRGRRPAPGVPADVSRRLAAGAIDVGVCAALTLLIARRRRLRVFAAVAAGYHVAAWSGSGRTIGGALFGAGGGAGAGVRGAAGGGGPRGFRLARSWGRFSAVPPRGARAPGR